MSELNERDTVQSGCQRLSLRLSCQASGSTAASGPNGLSGLDLICCPTRYPSHPRKPRPPHLSIGFALAIRRERTGFVSTSEARELTMGYCLSNRPRPPLPLNSPLRPLIRLMNPVPPDAPPRLRRP